MKDLSWRALERRDEANEGMTRLGGGFWGADPQRTSNGSLLQRVARRLLQTGATRNQTEPISCAAGSHGSPHGSQLFFILLGSALQYHTGTTLRIPSRSRRSVE